MLSHHNALQLLHHRNTQPRLRCVWGVLKSTYRAGASDLQNQTSLLRSKTYARYGVRQRRVSVFSLLLATSQCLCKQLPSAIESGGLPICATALEDGFKEYSNTASVPQKLQWLSESNHERKEALLKFVSSLIYILFACPSFTVCALEACFPANSKAEPRK